MTEPLYRNKDWLRQKYWNEEYSLHEIAEIAGTCYVTIWTWMKKLNIDRRGPAQRLMPRKPHHTQFSLQAIALLSGLLLGDGYLYPSASNCSALYSHTDKHLDYIVWLATRLADFGIKQTGRVYEKQHRNNTYYCYRSRFYPALIQLRQQWYPNGKKAIPIDFQITPTIIQNWYIGDGNFSRAPLIDSSIFTLESLRGIVAQLDAQGIQSTLCEFKDRRRLKIRKRSELTFFDYILSETKTVPSCYWYKFPQGVFTLCP